MPVRTAGGALARTLAVLSLVALPLSARGQEPVGGEFQVNTFTNGPQAYAAVARHANGTFMVVWSSTVHSGENGSGVFGRFYDADGAPLTDEVHINSYTTGTQESPDVAAGANGEYVVVWESTHDGSGRGIFGQRFGPAGVRLGGEFPVNAFTTQNQTLPRVVAATAGHFVVVWESYRSFLRKEDVYGRCFGADGTALTAEDFQVNTRTTQPQYLPDVAMSASGAFAVVWTDPALNRSDAQLYAADCQRVGADFAALEAQAATVAMDAAGNFVVAGISLDDPDAEYTYNVTARLFTAAGVPRGPGFLVNTVTTGSQDFPSVAMEPGGDFVVAWNEYTYPPVPTATDDVWTRAFRANGAAVGPDTVVNTYTTGGQQGTSVAADKDGNFVVVWTGPSDGSIAGIAAQRFLAPDALFADGFETGNLASWSNAVTDGGDLSVQPGAGLASTSAGLQAVIDDTAGIYVQDDSPSDEDRYRARLYFDPTGFDPGVAEGHQRTRVFIGFEEAPNRRLFAVVLRLQGTQYSLMGRVRRDDNGQADTGFFPIGAGAHVVEVDWRRATGPDALDGRFEMWIDGVSVSVLTGLDNSMSAMDFTRMGALSVKSGASGILRWDEFEARRRTEIGPRP